MSNEEPPQSTVPVLTTHRLEALVDGIFGFAMTLLAVNLTIPRGAEPSELGKILLGQLNGFYAYAISFLLLASFWLAHYRQFQHIKRTDGKHIWINILLLLFVVLMPFSTSLQANYSNTISDIFFGGNLMALGILLLANWVYATGGYRLVEQELDQSLIKIGLRRMIVTPVVTAVAMAVSVFYPHQSSIIYLLILFVIVTPPFRYRHR